MPSANVPWIKTKIDTGARSSSLHAFDIEHVARTINELESLLRAEIPHARVIYIEPDLYVEQPEIAPSTDHIVIQSGN